MMLLTKDIQRYARYYLKSRLTKILESTMDGLHCMMLLTKDIQKFARYYLKTKLTKIP